MCGFAPRMHVCVLVRVCVCAGACAYVRQACTCIGGARAGMSQHRLPDACLGQQHMTSLERKCCRVQSRVRAASCCCLLPPVAACCHLLPPVALLPPAATCCHLLPPVATCCLLLPLRHRPSGELGRQRVAFQEQQHRGGAAPAGPP